MSTSTEFYVMQAQSCAASAAATALPNLKDKYERAQAAWQALADREVEVKAARDVRDAEKAARMSEDELTEELAD